MSCRLNARWVLYESLLTPGGLTWLCSTRFWPLTHFYCTDISLYRHKIQPLISPPLVLSGSVGRKPCRFAECSELSLGFLLSSVWWGSDVPSLPSVWGLHHKLFPQGTSLIKVVYLKLVCVVSLRVSLHVVIAHRDSLRYNPAPSKGNLKIQIFSNQNIPHLAFAILQIQHGRQFPWHSFKMSQIWWLTLISISFQILVKMFLVLTGRNVCHQALPVQKPA